MIVTKVDFMSRWRSQNASQGMHRSESFNRTIPSVTDKVHLYQLYIKASKEKYLKNFARLRYDRINPALAGKLEMVKNHCG